MDSQRWTPITPVPDTAPEPPVAHFNYGKPVDRYRYRDGQGRLLGYTYRLNTPDGKIVLPMTYCQAENSYRWQWRSWDKPRPIYGLDGLARYPEATVLIVEGEKCRKAAGRRLGAEVQQLMPVAWVGGTNALSYVDWKPLTGRRCVLWPDADEPGLRCMQELAQILEQIECKIRILDVERV